MHMRNQLLWVGQGHEDISQLYIFYIFTEDMFVFVLWVLVWQNFKQIVFFRTAINSAIKVIWNVKENIWMKKKSIKPYKCTITIFHMSTCLLIFEQATIFHRKSLGLFLTSLQFKGPFCDPNMLLLWHNPIHMWPALAH